MSTVVILGSSGNVGSAVIKALGSKFPEVRVLAGVRDPSSGKASDLGGAGPNVSLVAADLGNPSSLDAAIPRDVDAVFVNTPGHIDRTQLAINGIDAAKRANAKHIVVISVLCADASGIFASQFSGIESHLKASGVRYTILRLPLFLENNWGNLKSVKEDGKLYGPATPDASFTAIAVSDIGEASAIILANPSGHENKTYKLTNKLHTHTETARAFSEATGKTVDYIQVPYEGAKAAFMGHGLPEWQVDGILELFHHIDAGAPYNREEPDFHNLTGHDPLTIQQWTLQVGGAFK